MPRNIEIKARIDSVDQLQPRVAALADQGPMQIAQDDRFYECANGRLKLRRFAADLGELIFYRRADEHGPKESFYLRSPTDDPEGLHATLAAAWGERGRVVKQRTLYLAGRTRIHLDRVEGLGDFLELEVVLADDDAADEGVREAHALMARLGVDPSQLVQGAYLDALNQRNSA